MWNVYNFFIHCLMDILVEFISLLLWNIVKNHWKQMCKYHCSRIERLLHRDINVVHFNHMVVLFVVISETSRLASKIAVLIPYCCWVLTVFGELPSFSLKSVAINHSILVRQWYPLEKNIYYVFLTSWKLNNVFSLTLHMKTY